MSTIVGYSKWLQWLAEVLDHSHPSCYHNATYPSYMNIGKLVRNSALTPDTCNGARKTCLIIVEKIHEDAEALLKDDSNKTCVLEVDYWNHLRSFVLGVWQSTRQLLLETQWRSNYMRCTRGWGFWQPSNQCFVLSIKSSFSVLIILKGADSSSEKKMGPVTLECFSFTSREHQVPAQT